MDTKQTQHTPGPWFVQPRTEKSPAYICTDLERVLDTEIAVVYGSRNEGNDRLIAAAPDLLAALEAVLSQIDPKDTPVGLGNILNARAALAKARGGA